MVGRVCTMRLFNRIFGIKPARDAPKLERLLWFRGYYLRWLPLTVLAIAALSVIASHWWIPVVAALLWIAGFSRVGRPSYAPEMPEEGKPRRGRVVASILTVVSGCLAFVVIRGLVVAAEGAHDSWQFWPVIAFFGLVSWRTGQSAVRRWRRIRRERSHHELP
jgi:hypothetical protein